MNEKTNDKSEFEANKTVEQKRILTVGVNRDCPEGLKIFIQSDVDWTIFSNNSGETFNIGGEKCLYPKEMTLPNVPGHFRMENEFEFDDYPNLSLLLAKNLQEGVTFKFGLVAISNERIMSWIGNLKNQAKILYLTFLKPVGIEVTITAETVERELHYQ